MYSLPNFAVKFTHRLLSLQAHTAANPVLLQESGGRDSGGRHSQHAVPV